MASPKPSLLCSRGQSTSDVPRYDFPWPAELTCMLPKATVQKIISEILTGLAANDPAGPSSEMTFAKDARDLLIECCVEFVTLISSEANEIAEKEAKKTIAAEHVVKALTELGFEEYIADIAEVAVEHKEQQKVSVL
jgi:histone H3/H4